MLANLVKDYIYSSKFLKPMFHIAIAIGINIVIDTSLPFYNGNLR